MDAVNDKLRRIPHIVSYGRRPDDYVNWRRLRRLIARCAILHPACSPPPSNVIIPEFRVIDVEKLRIVKPKAQCRYVALSYVWGLSGHGAGTSSTKANIATSEEGLSTDNLPNTILDAITTCRMLRERYLWVDRLCIIQDDEANKHTQINAMATVFSSAFLVIVPSSCKDMTENMPGVSVARMPHQLFSSGPFWDIKRSVWSTRGWTYQEVVLARRKLFFSTREALLECDVVTYQEGGTGDYAHAKSKDSFVWNTSLQVRSIHEELYDVDKYFSHLTEYTKRKLSFESDVYNAFAGIIDALYGEKAGVTYGLPLADFDHALLWRAKDSDSTRRSASSVMLPTWSWASVDGEVAAPFLEDLVGPLIQWVETRYLNASEVSTPVRPRNPPRAWHEQKSYLSGKSTPVRSLYPRYLMILALQSGLFVEEASNHSAIRFARGLPDEVSHIEAAARVRWPEYRDCVNDVFSAAIRTPRINNCGVLHAIGKTANFDITQADGVHYYNVADSTGRKTGRIWPDSKSDPMWSRENIQGLNFLGMSISLVYRRDDHTSENYVYQPPCSFSTYQWARTKRFPVVNTLLLEWQCGIARRLGAGWIHLADWMSAEKTVKYIALE